MDDAGRNNEGDMAELQAMWRDHMAVAAAMEEFLPVVHAMGTALIRSLEAGGKVLFCGNGGSAADAQHLAAELVVRFRRERRGLPGIALTVDSSVLTAGGNDYGFERVFARQVEALGAAGDVLVGYSTSGNSGNVLLAMETARAMGLVTVGLTGGDGGRLPALCDLCLKVPSSVTARIQECHLLAGHMMCEMVDVYFAEKEV